tara:strand:- start:174 stop:353 length:180 start_codon:yes stop_codon:yes gene_type:complete
MDRYWLKIRYEDGFERWELTQGVFKNGFAALKSHEHKAKACHYTVVDVKKGEVEQEVEA